jgi:hypothetical protein
VSWAGVQGKDDVLLWSNVHCVPLETITPDWKTTLSIRPVISGTVQTGVICERFNGPINQSKINIYADIGSHKVTI